jgi:hypothetical protein
MSKFAYLLNLADLSFTLHALSHGAEELNPLMRSVPIMIFSKIIVVGALLWWLSKIEEPIAKKGLWIVTAYFGAIVLWHIYNLAVVLMR